MIYSINKVFRLILIPAMLLISNGFSSGQNISFAKGNSACLTIAKESPISFASFQKNHNETKELSQSNLEIVSSEDFSEKSYLINSRYNADLKLRINYTTFLISHFATST